jgi:ribosomal protein S18 acetylase RimI-like enzyme
VIDPDVRRAEPADAFVLSDLERQARAELRDSRGGGRWLDTHPPLVDAWAEAIGERVVYVATIPADDGTDVVVGFLVADRADDPMPIARIDQVYVAGEARELGFGDALVAAAMDGAREQGVELIEAETLPGDRNLKNLYERAGVTARLITVSKKL